MHHMHGFGGFGVGLGGGLLGDLLAGGLGYYLGRSSAHETGVYIGERANAPSPREK